MTALAPTMTPMAMSGATPSREAVATFLSKSINMMRSDEICQLLRDREAILNPGMKLIELQRAEWDQLGIDRDVGCQTLDRLHLLFPGDADILLQRSEFTRTAMRSYIEAVEGRRPETLQRDGKLERETILDFFDACNTKMDLPETREVLAKHLQETTEVPNKLVVEIQRDMLEVMGIEKEHGCKMLSRIGSDFPDDKVLHGRFNGWRMKAQSACMEVVKAYQASGGQMPGGFITMSPDMREKEAEVRKELDAMPEEKKQELLGKYQPKVEVFMKLPLQNRMEYMEKMSDDDRPDFLKAQMLLVGIMQKQWKDGAARGGAPAAGNPSTSSAAPAMPGIAASTPQQQQMM